MYLTTQGHILNVLKSSTEYQEMRSTDTMTVVQTDNLQRVRKNF